MMMTKRQLVWSANFNRAYKKIVKKNPQFKEEIILALDIMENDLYQRVEKVLIQLAVQKFQVQGAKKVQDRSLPRATFFRFTGAYLDIRKSLNFL